MKRKRGDSLILFVGLVGSLFFIFSITAHAAHSADTSGNCQISLQELLRVVQFFNMSGYGCDDSGQSVDGYIPGSTGNQECPRHNSDYDSVPWKISLQELLRLIQFFNMVGYHCASVQNPSADGFLPGPDDSGCDCAVEGEGEGGGEGEGEGEGEVDITITLPGNVPLVLVRIPSGTFDMGSPVTERGRYDVEGPVHTVTIADDFYMGKYEVTQAQWLALMEAWPTPEVQPSETYGLGGNYPAYYISWVQVQAFIGALNAYIAESGQGPLIVRLPSEAEWEYACRAGAQTRFFFGDSLDCDDNLQNCSAGTLPGLRGDYMWYGGNNEPDMTKEVGQKLPNPFGLYDMHGNVAELCEDDYWFEGYTNAPTDGSAWVQEPRSAFRIVRGGIWMDPASNCRSASRGCNGANAQLHIIGFRLAAIEGIEYEGEGEGTPEGEGEGTPEGEGEGEIGPIEQIMLPGAVPLELVRIDAAPYLMGANPTDAKHESGERPQHKVWLDRDYYIGKFEITQKEWYAIMGAWPTNSPTAEYGLGDAYPIYNVTWFEAKTFIDALNAYILSSGQPPLSFRLPTEAEWEYACRGGTTTRYYFGNAMDCPDTLLYESEEDRCANCPAGGMEGERGDYMWFCGNKDELAYGLMENRMVGQKLPNGFGLFDMHGGVWEWCEDDYHENYMYAPQDGSAWVDSPRAAYRVRRGGSFLEWGNFCRSASRGSMGPQYPNIGTGFRVVAEVLDPVEGEGEGSTEGEGEGSTEGEGEVPFGTILLPEGIYLELNYLPGGYFQMGSPENEFNRRANEGPAHFVNIAPFFIGKCELTWAQYLAVVRKYPGEIAETTQDFRNNTYPAGGGPYGMCWNDAKAFVAELNKYIAWSGQGPLSVRLPSEAEWEYACRAGTYTRLYFGDATECDDNPYEGEADCPAGTMPGLSGDYLWYKFNNAPEGLKPVGQKLPNAFGLYDMHGNISEWVEDDQHLDYTGAPLDGSAWVDEPETSEYRMIRGGAASSYVQDCRSAYRASGWKIYRSFTGFRVAASLAAEGEGEGEGTVEGEGEGVVEGEGEGAVEGEGEGYIEGEGEGEFLDPPVLSVDTGLMRNVGIYDVSSEFLDSGWDLAAVHTVDGSGLGGVPPAHDMLEFPGGNSWQTITTTGTGSIAFDLQETVSLRQLHVWNLNFYDPYNGRGAKDVALFTSTDGVNWIDRGTRLFEIATGVPGDPGFDVPIANWTKARYLRLDIINNFGYADNAGHVGLSEVQFHKILPSAFPTWRWASGGENGSGVFRFKLDNTNLSNGAALTIDHFFTPSTPLTPGSHTIYIQEQDMEGNWTETASRSVTVEEPVEVNFETDGTVGATLEGAPSQLVGYGQDASPVTAMAPDGYHFTQWTIDGVFYSQDNPVTANSAIADILLRAEYAAN